MPETIEFEAGQRWAYQTRPEDPESTLVIGKVESLSDGEPVVHISVVDVNIKSPRAAGGFTHAVHHMPISPDALRDSVTQLSGTSSPAAQFHEGYQIWRTAADQREAGIFSIPVREAVEHFESIINSSR